MRETSTEKALLRSTGRDMADVLRELYIEKRHTDREIAEAFGVERATVQQWRAKYGITRNERPPVVVEGSAA
jgi:transposase